MTDVPNLFDVVMSQSRRGFGYDIVGVSRTRGFNGHVRSKSA